MTRLSIVLLLAAVAVAASADDFDREVDQHWHSYKVQYLEH